MGMMERAYQRYITLPIMEMLRQCGLYWSLGAIRGHSLSHRYI